jgi:hypothetical protein
MIYFLVFNVWSDCDSNCGSEKSRCNNAWNATIEHNKLIIKNILLVVIFTQSKKLNIFYFLKNVLVPACCILADAIIPDGRKALGLNLVPDKCQ